jgi:hypothetical protein
MGKRNDKWCGNCIFVNTKYGDCSKYKIKLLFHAIKNGSIYGNQELARCGQCLRDGRPKQNWFECMNGVEFKQ